jgi:hypothetical protein
LSRKNTFSCQPFLLTISEVKFQDTKRGAAFGATVDRSDIRGLGTA